ncbi:GNAT family N-acetyltransferase [Pantoea ananatis]|uniref:GNAT family N-acetyltransferase n=1 Tax=Pantoea ananas TaxID=553 RepID=UPI00222163E3|nr:GNAT family N-acetyltransferase [Pantoea ananatis]MCW1834154.1 GNAT family N-acetyltransferase [Pantoea ananatis]
MEVTVEMCPPDEWESMVKIFTEMEEHYYGKGIIQEPLLKNYLCNRLFSKLSGTLVLRARNDAVIVGLACCSILYPSPRYSGQLHIKELYVSQSERGKGTGESIMRFMAKLALEHECRSLSWNAEKSNAGANRFYQSLGGRVNDDVVSYYLHGELLRKLASDSSAEPDNCTD